MLLIPVRVDRSPIHGLGLFATEPIAAGIPVWRFQPGFDQVFSLEAFAALPARAQSYVGHFGFLDAARQRWVLNGDMAVFMNHAVTPNTGAPEATGVADVTVALRSIEAGEEITCDYRAFDAGKKPLN